MFNQKQIDNIQFTVVRDLFPTGEFEIMNDIVTFIDDNVMSSEMYDNRKAEILAEYARLEYSRNRKEEYDALNQLEMQFDDKEDGTTTWEDAIKAIKTKYPKG
jgi:hypothetical protein